MVEQWTENPCVPGSIPGGTTKPTQNEWVFCFKSSLFRFHLFPQIIELQLLFQNNLNQKKEIIEFHKIILSSTILLEINYLTVKKGSSI
jgi:hypothetical protein